MIKKALVLYSSNALVCGIGTWVESLARGLNPDDWDIIVGLAWGKSFHNPRSIEIVRPSLNTVWLDGRTGTEEGRIQAIEETIRKVQPDIVLLTCLDSAFEAVRRLKYGGAKFRFVATNHGNLPEQAACLLQHRDIIDMIVSISKLSVDVMRTHAEGYDPRRIRYIPNAVPLPVRFSERSEGAPARVGYAGRIDDDKRAADIVPFYQALRSLVPSAELWVAGRGKRENDILALAQEFPDRVKYFGQFSHDELYKKFYPAIDVLVSFSPSEAWGYSIAEAMAHGVVPVISEHRGVHADGLVRNNENGFMFPVSDTVRPAEIVAALFRDPVRLRSISAAAAENSRKRFSIEQFSKAWSDAMNKCLSLPVLQTQLKPSSLCRKGRLGLSERSWENVRRLLGRKVSHESAGEEWPHFSCRDTVLIEKIRASLESAGDGK